mmetsp:Transcript_42446/g.165706  ORF Transcript_42446/g.165706 Transcript_42446/m.165706 type:complete len:210 (+) Transcript_42446:354-983(+)
MLCESRISRTTRRRARQTQGRQKGVHPRFLREPLLPSKLGHIWRLPEGSKRLHITRSPMSYSALNMSSGQFSRTRLPTTWNKPCTCCTGKSWQSSLLLASWMDFLKCESCLFFCAPGWPSMKTSTYEKRLTVWNEDLSVLKEQQVTRSSSKYLRSTKVPRSREYVTSSSQILQRVMPFNTGRQCRWKVNATLSSGIRIENPQMLQTRWK